MLAAQEIIETSLTHLPDLAALARAVHLSERSLSRRFSKAVGQSLRGYTAESRLEMARLLLAAGREPLTAIADDCGYGSVSAPVRAFSSRHGVSPAGYRANLEKRPDAAPRESSR